MRWLGIFVVALGIGFSPGLVSAAGVDAPYGGPQETEQASRTEGIYYPFSIVGHGALFVGKYLIGYPLWFLFQPAHEFLYSSSQDPNDMPDPELIREDSPDRPAP